MNSAVGCATTEFVYSQERSSIRVALNVQISCTRVRPFGVKRVDRMRIGGARQLFLGNNEISHAEFCLLLAPPGCSIGQGSRHCRIHAEVNEAVQKLSEW